MTNEEFELICMQMITNSGSAERLMNEGDEFFSEAHGVHGNLLAQEASGDKVEFSLILMHAEDQMASTEMAKVLAREIIELYQKR